MKYNLAYKYRIYPNEIQANLILQTFGCARFVYNKILAKADEIYKLEGKNKIVTPASLKTEFQKDIKEVLNDNNIVGLDFSMSELFVSSDNQRADYPRFFRKLEAKLIKAQKELSRKVKFSSNWNKAKLKVAKIHQSIKNNRKDFLHKLSHELVSKYNVIILEDLNMKGMSQALNFGKSVVDNGWGSFTTMLQYKAMFLGKQVIKIDRFFPSSKTCSFCGAVKTELSLSERIYKCDECDSEIDRDLNASINIREVGENY